MNARRRATSLLGAGLILAASLVTAGPAGAETSPPPPTGSPEALHEASVGDSLIFSDPADTPAEVSPSTTTSTLRAASFTITCTVSPDSPHISDGARKLGKIYVVYKTRVSCAGTGAHPATATIRVRGGLMWDSAAYNGDTSNGVDWQLVRSSDDTATVNVNGGSRTFYTPASGEEGGTSVGHYQGSSTVEITAPTGQKVGSGISTPVFCAPTTPTAVCS